MAEDISEKLKALVLALQGGMEKLTSYPLPPGSENIVPEAKSAYGAVSDTFRGAMPRAAAASDALAPLASSIVEAAGNDMTGGLPLGAGLGMIRAYHGTAQPFDVFDASKIGTGEGSQMLGPGFYVAENRNVAKQYPTPSENRFVQDVMLRPDKSDFIDFDKPISQQSAKVQEILRKSLNTKQLEEFYRTTEIPFSQIHYHMAESFGGSDGASKWLASHGIPGIKYLDQGSRGAGEGTYNFVMFRPEDIVVDAVNGYQLAPGSSRVSPFVGPYRPGAWVDEAKPVEDPLLGLVTTLEEARRGK